MRKTTNKHCKDSRILLPGNCYASKLSVHPENWQEKDVQLETEWYIHYRFHDPQFKHLKAYQYGKLCKVRGMNGIQSLATKRLVTKSLLDAEKALLLKGFNPITEKFYSTDHHNSDTEYIIHPECTWLKAIELAAERMNFVRSTRADIKSMIGFLQKSAENLSLSERKISEIKRPHIIKVLENCKKSANRQNKFRSYLHTLFDQLETIETIEFNPVKKIPIIDTIKDEDIHREVLTPEQRIKVDRHLRSNFPTFWRLLHIFFHAGCRETEILRLQGKDVDLANQRFKITILKGASKKRVWKAIKTVALPFWQDVMKNCKGDDFVFSVGLSPGTNSIRPDQISRRWRVHVKKKLGITADFYALKHLNSDETAVLVSEQEAARLAGLEAAAGQNSHTTTKTTAIHYAVGDSERRLNGQKKINNTFVPITCAETS